MWNNHWKMKQFLILIAVMAGVTSVAIAGKDRASCIEVRRSFASKRVGPMKMVPYKAIRTTKLEICPTAEHTCCNRKMEKKYEAAAREDLAATLKEKADFLKEQFANFLEDFEDDFKKFLVQTKNEIIAKFNSTISDVGEMNSLIDSVFDVSGLFRNKNDDVIDNLKTNTRTFFSRILMLVVSRQMEIHPSSTQLNCISRLINPEFSYDALVFEKLSFFHNLTAAFFRAVHSGIEILSSPTDAFISSECERGLVKMQFCSHCYGLTLIEPCSNYCRNVMSGCLVGISEIDQYWKYYVTGLNDVIERMSAEDADPESITAALVRHINELETTEFGKETVNQIQQKCFHNSPRLKRSTDNSNDEMKSKKRHQRKRHRRRNQKADRVDLELSSEMGVEMENPLTPRRIIPPPHEMLRWEPSLTTKGRKKDNEKEKNDEQIMGGMTSKMQLNLKSKLRRFVAHLNLTSDNFSTIAEDLCTTRYGSSYSVSLSGDCWNGESITKNYSIPIVKNGWQHQRGNPEVKVTGLGIKTEEVITQLRSISKFLMIQAGKSRLPKHLLLAPDYVTLSDQSEAPCADDEDACAASGSGGDFSDEGQRQNKVSPKRKHHHGKKNHDKKKQLSNGKDNKLTNPTINIMADVNGQITDYLLPDKEKSSPKSLDGDKDKSLDSKNKGPGGSASPLTVSFLSWRTILVSLLILQKLIT